MQETRRSLITSAVILILFFIGLGVLSTFPEYVEEYYSSNLYISIAQAQRFISGFLPFAVGDVVYTLYAIWWLVTLIDVVKAVSKKTLLARNFWMETSYNIRQFVFIIIVFYLLWGINYQRYGIAYQMNLTAKGFQPMELKPLGNEVVQTLNTIRAKIKPGKIHKPRSAQMYSSIATAYSDMALDYEFISYEYPSIKNSLYGGLMAKFGISGYYNPFTGEANVNNKLPSFIVPAVAAHEVAHQIGYASEDEASFVGYLSTRYTVDPLIVYSQTLDLYFHILREVGRVDTALVKQWQQQLHPGVKQDIAEYREYLQNNESFLNGLSSAAFDGFLKANSQEQGIQSYNLVLEWVLAFRKKNKHLYDLKKLEYQDYQENPDEEKTSNKPTKPKKSGNKKAKETENADVLLEDIAPDKTAPATDTTNQ
ncbi:MAG: DUF3810 domain-containing protein [Bacteroidetes bacterium]|nr:MAG: DUF3810 domain-containing protein [Bacteroidota bacterium]TAF92996.1 MAG: DUF3810 domain-containing protein [Bacteroidota bacterium]